MPTMDDSQLKVSHEPVSNEEESHEKVSLAKASLAKASLEEAIATRELNTRPSRAPEHALENEMVFRLFETLGSAPG